MAKRIKSRRRWHLAFSTPRAFLEAMVLGMAMVTLLQRYGTNLQDIQYVGVVISVILICMMVYTLRLPLPTGPWWRQILFESVAGPNIALLIAWLLFEFVLSGAPHSRLEQFASGELLWIDAGVLIVMIPTILMRSLKYMGRYWEQIRQKYLIWELTHGHLVLVTLDVMLMAVGVIVASSLVEPGPFIHNLFNRVISGMSLGSGLFILLILVILLPSSILAFSTSRRITRRLEAMTNAFDALRSGNYKERVQVQGRDEVAQLQLNFNSMADDLQNALTDLQAERDTVAELLKSRRELFAGVSHDLRTPVATLRAYIESTLEHKANGVSHDLRQDMENMCGEVIHLQRLIDDLFSLARVEVDRLDFKLEIIEILPILHRIVKSASPIAWRKGKVQIVLDLPDKLPLVEVDKDRLEQIVNNLLQNALRHTPPGGVIAVSTWAKEETVCIQVKDAGEGISSEELPLIWEPFYRSIDSLADRSGGAGLGLALVKEMTEAMKGSVVVESEIGEGSCFTIRLPSYLPGRASEPADS